MSQDGIYQQSEGLTVLDVTQDDDGGYSATFGIGLDLSQPTQTQTGGGSPGGAPPSGGSL